MFGKASAWQTPQRVEMLDSKEMDDKSKKDVPKQINEVRQKLEKKTRCDRNNQCTRACKDEYASDNNNIGDKPSQQEETEVRTC